MAELPDYARGLTEAMGAEASMPETVADDDPRLGELRGLADPPAEEEPEQPQFGPLAQQLDGEGYFDSLINDQFIDRESKRIDGIAQSKFAEEQEKAAQEPGLGDKLGKAFTRGAISFKQQWNTYRATNLLSELNNLDDSDQRTAPLGGSIARRKQPRGAPSATAGQEYDYLTPEQRAGLRTRFQKDLAEQIKSISARQIAIEAIPQPPEVVEALEAKTFSEFWSKFKKAPITFISTVGVESLPAMAPSLAAGTAGFVVGGPVGAAMGAGAGSFYTDYMSQVVGGLYAEGVNVRDPEALAAGLANKALMERVGNRAKKHAAGVAALDAASAGVASKVLLPARALATRPLTREAANVAVQLPVQGTLGATGEVVGSLASGQEIRPGDVGAEFFGEFIGAPAEVAGMRGAAAATEQPQQTQTTPPIPETPTAPRLEVQRGGDVGGLIPLPEVVNRIVTPDASMEVEATPQIVDLADLIFASGDLQPRDRTRLESDVGVRNRAANLDPSRLLPGRVSDAGAPIVAADGTIVSGNGRVLSIREVYTDPALKAQADAYREALGPKAEGMVMPVLVQRLGDMEPAELARFADLSNRPATTQMSATERAQRDARAGGADIMGLYTGGSFTSPANREFLRTFADQVVGSGERGAFSKDGQLTKEGEDRMAAAVLAAAYGDSDLLARMLESTDDNIRNVTGALRDASGAFTRLKQAVESGTTSAEFDISSQLAETAKRIADLRDRNIKPAAFLAQTDAFSDTDPVVEALLRTFYNDDLIRPLSREKLTETLIRYAEEAQKHTDQGLLPDDTTPQDVLAVARQGALEDRGEPLFRPSIVGPGVAGGGRGVRGREDAGSGPDALYGRFQQLLAEGTRPDPQAFAQTLGIDEAGLQPLIDQGIKDGLLRVNARGQVRRTGKAITAAPTAEAAPAVEPRLPAQRSVKLAVPADQLIDRKVTARETQMRRAVPIAVVDYAVQLEDALGTAEFQAIFEALKADKAMQRADVHDLAALLLDVPVAKSASKEAALQAIADKHIVAMAQNVEVEQFVSALGGRQPLSAKAIRDGISAMVKRGEVVKLPARVIADVHAAAEPMLGMVPDDITVTAVARIEPSGIDASVVRLVLQGRDGAEHVVLAPWNVLDGVRAFHLPGRGIIGLVRYLPRSRDTTGQFDRHVAAKLGHEVVHALRGTGRLNGARWQRLLGHAKSLKLLDGQFGTYLATVGDPYANQVADVTTREAYAAYYSTRQDLQEVMDQEEVTHMLEWHLRGLLTPEEVAPVRDLIDAILAGDSAAAAPDYATEVAEQLAALGASVQEFTPELDARGFYSPSLEAAKQIPQATGTVQQMRAMLLKAGAKPKELEAVGFDKAFPDPNAKVSRAEIERYLRDHRVQLGSNWPDDLPAIQNRLGEIRSELMAIEQAPRTKTNQLSDEPRWLRLKDEHDQLTAKFPGTGRYESYSTPGGIPGSYREVVTTLPATEPRVPRVTIQPYGPESTKWEYIISGETGSFSRTFETEAEARAAADKAVRELHLDYGKPGPNTYTSSHWPGITNPVLHYRTKDFSAPPALRLKDSIDDSLDGILVELGDSEWSARPDLQARHDALMKDRGEAPYSSKVRVLDELQSDWAQRARDQGTRDPAAIEGLRQQSNAAHQESLRLNHQAVDFLKEAGAYKLGVPGGIERSLEVVESSGSKYAARAAELRAELSAAYDRSSDLMNKINAAEHGVPAAPYISNTSDWVDLGLKQALLDAARDPSVTRFAWAPGKEHIRRYPNLSTVVDEIGIGKPEADGTRSMLISGKFDRNSTSFKIDAQGRVLDGEYAGHTLHEVVGKDMANRLLATKGADVFDGDRLNVPTAEGIGMGKYYGDFNEDGAYTPGIVGTRLLKIVKGLDPEAAQIEAGKITQGYPKMPDGSPNPFAPRNEPLTYPSIRITPRLREALLGGQPLFALGGKAPIPAIQTEAEHLTTDVAAFEQRLWDEGKTAEEIAASLHDRYGFEVTPADLALNQVWWKLTQGRGRREPLIAELLTEDRDSLLRQYLAEGDETLKQATDPQAAPDAPQTLQGGQTPQRFPSTGRNLNAVQREAVAALWAQGLSPVQIARQLAEESGHYVRLTSVSDALASIGILDKGKHATRPKPPRTVVWSPEVNALLASQDAAGLTAAQLASRVAELIDRRVTAKAVHRQRAKLRAKGAEIPLAYATPSERAAAMNDGKFQWTDAALAVLTSKDIDGLNAAGIAKLLNDRFGGQPLSANAVRQKKSKLGGKTFLAAIGGPTDPEAWLNALKDTQDARPRNDAELRGETDPASGAAGTGEPGTGATAEPSQDDHRYRGRVGQPGRFDIPGGKLSGAVFRGRSLDGLGEHWYFIYAKEDPAFPSSQPTPERQLKIVKGLGNWTTKAHLIERQPGAWELIGLATRRNRRRRGLAAQTWDAIEADLGVSLTPPGRLTRDLYRFLEKRKPALIAPYQRLANGLYYAPQQLMKLLTIHQEIANQPSDAASPQLKREIAQAQKGVAEITEVLGKLPADASLFDTALGGSPEFNAAIGARPPLQMGSVTATGMEAPEQSLTDLVGEVTDALGLTSRIGRLSPGLKLQAAQQGGTLMGQFGTVTGVVRTKLPNDLQTLAHEGGHALEVRPSLRADLDALKRAQANELTATIPDLSEGFAEFFRTYVTNQAQAQAQAPQFFQAFEDLLDAKEPAMLEALESVQAGVAALANASPVGIVRSRIQSTVKPRLLARVRTALVEDGLRNTFADRLYGFYHASFDAKHPFKVGVQYLLGVAEANLGRPLAPNEKLVLKAINDPYKLARLSEHAKVHATATLQNGVVPKGQDLPTGASFWLALETAFGGKARGQWNDEMAQQFGSYLVSRRMLAEFERFHRGELAQAPDQLILPDVWSKAYVELERAHPNFAQAADLLYQFNQNLLQLKLDNGFLTPELYAELTQRTDYVPLNRVMDDGAPSVLIRAKGQNKAAMIRTFKGSQRDFINPLESIAQDVYATQARIALNDTIRALDRLARAAGPGGGRIAERIPAKDMKGMRVDVREALRLAARDANLDADQRQALFDTIDDLFDQNVAANIFRATETNERGEPIVYLWEGGVKVPIRLGDDRIGRDIFQVFQALGQDNSDTIIDTLALGAQALRFGVTKSLDYFAANILRDQLATWILSTDFTPFVTAAKGTKGLVPGSELAQRYAAFAGMMGGIDTALTEELAQRDVLALRRKGFFGTPAKGRAGTVYQTTIRALESSEAVTRFGHFEAAYKRALADGFTPEESAIEAAYAAHDVMDFSRRGAKVGIYARITAFLNAALQGLDAARRTMSGERNTYQSYRELATPYLKAATGSPLSVAEKQALPNAVRIWVKMAAVGLIAGVGLAALYRDDEEAEEHNYYMRATHWFFKLGGTWARWPKPFELAGLSNLFEATFDLVWKRDERAFEKFRASLFYTMIPPSDPNLLRFIYEEATGYDLFRGQEIVPQHLQKLPPEMQFNAYTSELGREIGKVTGLSPARIDHVISGLFGTVGRQAMTLSDYAVPRLTGREPRAEKSLEDMWFLSRFTRRAARGSLSTQEFWEQMTQSGGAFVRAAEGYKQELKFGNRRSARDLIEGLDDEPKAYAVLEGHFEEEDQDLHPLNRARQVLSVASNIRRDMVLGRLFKQKSNKQGAYRDQDKYKPERIVLSPTKQKIVNEILEDISMREARNALIVIGHPGWVQKNITLTDDLLTELEATAPEVAAEFAYRQAHGSNTVYAFEAVKALWPQVKERLLKNGEDARFSDLKGKAKAIGRAKRPVTGGIQLTPDAQPETNFFAPLPGMMRLGGPLPDIRPSNDDGSGPLRPLPPPTPVPPATFTPDDDAGGIIAPKVMEWMRAQPTDL